MEINKRLESFGVKVVIDRILVVVRRYQGASLFEPHNGHMYQYFIAMPLGIVPESMREELKMTGNEQYFRFSEKSVPARTTADTVPGYVCNGGWFWKPAWLCWTDKGYVFESFEPFEFAAKLAKLGFPLDALTPPEGCSPDCVAIGNTGFIAHNVGCPRRKENPVATALEQERVVEDQLSRVEFEPKYPLTKLNFDLLDEKEKNASDTIAQAIRTGCEPIIGTDVTMDEESDEE